MEESPPPSDGVETPVLPPFSGVVDMLGVGAAVTPHRERMGGRMSFWERGELDDPEEQLQVTSSVSVLSPSLHVDLTLTVMGKVVPLQTCLVERAAPFTSQSIWLSPPQFTM